MENKTDTCIYCPNKFEPQEFKLTFTSIWRQVCDSCIEEARRMRGFPGQGSRIDYVAVYPEVKLRGSKKCQNKKNESQK